MRISQSLEGKKVQITCKNGEILSGVVLDYIFPEDNYPEGIAAIDIEHCPQRNNQSVSINDNEIDSIEIIS